MELKLPDFLTSFGLFLALFSIFLSFNHFFLFAYLAIIGQYFFDILDGVVARRFGGGVLGLFLDSFSDYTAIIAVVLFGLFLGANNIFFIFSSLFFILFAAIRLSFFTDRALNKKNDFIGLPTVFITFIVSTILIINYYLNIINPSFFWIIYTIGGYLMVADIKLKKIKL